MIWKKILGFANHSASDTGQIRRDSYVDTNNHIMPQLELVQEINSSGYKRVSFLGKQHFVHRLVALAFLVGKDETVNHIDGNKFNNFAYNLEWLSQSENTKHSFRNGRQGTGGKLAGVDHALFKLHSELVAKIKQLKIGGFSNREIGRQLNLSHCTVAKALR
jgi:hypothetical protein